MPELNKDSNYINNDSRSRSFYEAVYTIGVASEKIGISDHSLRLYESEGLIIPHKTKTGRRLYSDLDLEKVLCIKQMIKEEGLNFEGIRRLLSLVPCWKIRNCNSDNGAKCKSYMNRTKPCWDTEEKCLNPLESCRDCTVYKSLVNCDDVESYIKEKQVKL
ncbi:MerR family transcriptional regulator [Spirochaetota bacterium]